MRPARPELPIDARLEAIVQTLAQHGRLVLEAPPGAGKTTRVPPALLASGLLPQGEIVVLEPRRLAARLAARRVADELGEALGNTVGYQVRFEEIASPRTRIRFVTEGVLTRRLLRDPHLRGVGAVLLDEFHERHVHGDIALALLHRLQRGPRPDLKLVVMSATLDAGPIAAFLEAPTLRVEGKRFDVSLEHLPAPDDRPLASLVASAVRTLTRPEGGSATGHILVFLPGASEIRRAREACEPVAREHGLELTPLHGDLTPEEQDRAVRREAGRRVILATNIAESSVTIEGVVAVVDAGLVQMASHAPWSGVPTLRLEKISRASATQRAGRAGRTGPGRCLRLYTKADFETRPEHDVPEIQRVDLAQTFLELAGAGQQELVFFDPPPVPAARAARELLVRLGAVDEAGAITALGETMLRFPVHPRVARMLVEAERRGVGADAAVVAALLGERDIRQQQRANLRGPSGGGGARGAGGGGVHAGAATERSDLVALVDLFGEAEASNFRDGALRAMELDRNAVLTVARAEKQIAGPLRRGIAPPEGVARREDALLQSVLAGYPDRVAKRQRAGSPALSLGGGGSAELAETSTVRHAEWMVAVDADRRGAGSGPLRVRLASAIEPEWLLDLFADRVVEEARVTWNAARERVEARSVMTYEGLVLAESAGAGSAQAEVARVLAEAALAAGPEAFVKPEGALDAWLTRARFAATVSDLVAPDDEQVRATLRELCEGRSSFAELREAGLLEVLKGGVSAQGSGASSRIEQLAPPSVPLAAGRSVAVNYEPGKPPYGESYLQDFFGMLDTPRVGGGRVPLVVHLWAPNKRAVQVTSDLRGFWERHYPALRKELQRKYPRHSWPEDPTVVAPRYKAR